MIEKFSGQYRWLSNFWPCRIIYQGAQYPSTENAYQAAKVVGSDRSLFMSCSPSKSKRLGRKLANHKNWESEKLRIMEFLLRQKFSPGTELAVKLIATGTDVIVEGNDWGDTFWGACAGLGDNNLGKLLMRIREDISSATRS